MVWIPGVDEVPMSLSGIGSDGISSITVAEVGRGTKALHNKKLGEKIGVRGPYGNGFTPITGNVMLVSGGTGIAPLLPLIESLVKLPTKITAVFGAKKSSELILLDRLEATLSVVKDARIISVTEDGSKGLSGFAIDPVEKLMSSEFFDMVYTCGVEKMMHRIFLLTEKYRVPLQASLERFMRCGIGLCGSCMLGEFRVCKDGPVFSSQQLRKVKSEFGNFTRGPDGRRIAL
jgi:dihydroorotate dehydrogenase electron transfer subunit